MQALLKRVADMVARKQRQRRRATESRPSCVEQSYRSWSITAEDYIGSTGQTFWLVRFENADNPDEVFHTANRDYKAAKTEGSYVIDGYIDAKAKMPELGLHTYLHLCVDGSAMATADELLSHC